MTQLAALTVRKIAPLRHAVVAAYRLSELVYPLCELIANRPVSEGTFLREMLAHGDTQDLLILPDGALVVHQHKDFQPNRRPSINIPIADSSSLICPSNLAATWSIRLCSSSASEAERGGIADFFAPAIWATPLTAYQDSHVKGVLSNHPHNSTGTSRRA